MTETILKTRGLTKRFGALTAVDNFDIDVVKNSIHSIIGPNGAGKTTLFNLITGMVKPDSGSIVFNSVETTNLPPHKLCQLGMCRSFQITSIFPGLTVKENVSLACESSSGGLNIFSSVLRFSDASAKADEILKQLQLWGRRDELAANLSHGEQRLLEIAIALATDPKLLLLDEPTSGMTDLESRRVGRLIKEITMSRDLTVVMIEHDLEVVKEISDIITVMHMGKKVAEGRAEELRLNPQVKEIYLGEF